MSLNKLLQGKYLLCLCEGAAEMDIMNRLLEADLLVFHKDDLVQKKFHKREKVEKIQEKFLNQAYEKEVVILRVIDSRSEKFNLDKAYRGRFDEIPIRTKPEIEILIILDKKGLKAFDKKKSMMKPSVFCKEVYRMKAIKKRGFMNAYFKDIDSLVAAIREYQKKSDKSHWTIGDLLR